MVADRKDGIPLAVPQGIHEDKRSAFQLRPGAILLVVYVATFIVLSYYLAGLYRFCCGVPMSVPEFGLFSVDVMISGAVLFAYMGRPAKLGPVSTHQDK